MSEAAEKILEAVRSNDLVKAKNALAEGMKPVLAALLESEEKRIAKTVMIEGEEAKDTDEEDESEDGKDDEEDEE